MFGTIIYKNTLEHFNCDNLDSSIGDIMFDFWRKPNIFIDSLAFFNNIKIPKCIVSNIDRDDILAALDYHNLRPEAVVTSKDARAYRPRFAIFKMPFKKMNVKPGKVLHIGGSFSSDIIGAKSCGVDAFWINRKNKPPPSVINSIYTGNSLLDVYNFVSL